MHDGSEARSKLRQLQGWDLPALRISPDPRCVSGQAGKEGPDPGLSGLCTVCIISTCLQQCNNRGAFHIFYFKPK